MTLKTIRTKSISEAMQELERFAERDDEFLFRGHSNESWTIMSTLQRHTTIPHQSWDDSLDDMLAHFLVNLRSIGQLPDEIAPSRRARLEYGRHHGVPSPLIDFSLSPYVALFFAFNGVRPSNDTSKCVVVYALNIRELGQAWAQRNGALDQNAFDEFMYERKSLFEHGYPGDTLKYIRFPASWNKRMQRQRGVFVYDTLNYAQHHRRDLEDYAEKYNETPGPSTHPVLTKIYVPASEAGAAFARLEAMAISASHLYDSSDGAAQDVVNSYNYNRKTGYAWDLKLPPPDEKKM